MQHKMHIVAGGHIIDSSKRTLIMGIVNLTPDSFSKDGLLHNSSSPKAHVRFIKKLIANGADIIDIGAESSRPGALKVSSKEEIKRLIPTLKVLIPSVSVPVSVDSYKTEVIHAALDCGVSIVNNIQGLKLTKSLLKLVKDYNAAIVLMHMRGSPRTMQQKTRYKNLLADIHADLKSSIDFCLDFGLKKDRIIIDPGFGFAKDAMQNIQLLQQLSTFKKFHIPILVGTSRKSFLGKALGDIQKDRLAATAASVSVSIINGANIVRVHDVAFMKDVATITDLTKHA
jgi:dihydropteroate synthase